MKCGLIVCCVFSLSLLAGLALAAWEPVMPPGNICDTENRVCFRGRIDFDPNRKTLEIQGRLYQTAGEGVLTFEFTGETPLQEHVFHSTAVKVEGQYNEGISHKIRPPYSNRTDWSLSRLTFTAD